MGAVTERDLLAEVRAFLRAEATPRASWRRRAWLGRRAAFALIERVVLGRYWTSVRADDEARHRFCAALLDALEAAGAVDFLTAGSWAESLADPVADTAPVTRWRGEKTPAPGERRPPGRRSED